MIHRLGAARATRPDVAVPDSLDLDACYGYCEALCHSRHHNYPVASFFARSTLRKHIWACFAFARIADDIVDAPRYEGRRARELDLWEKDLHATYFGQVPQHPVLIALADTVQRYSLPITEFSALLSGFRTDLEVRRYATFNELRSYTAQAAEPLGHLLLYIGGYRSPELLAYGDDLASGLAMAGLLQDLAVDLARDRVYLPSEDLRHFGVSERDLAARTKAPAIAAMVRYEVARTRALFTRARPLVEQVGSDLAVELALMWHGGWRILDKIACSGDHILISRPRLGSLDKAIALTRAVAWRGGSLGPRLAHLIDRLS
jgi:squalene synthase HpnC